MDPVIENASWSIYPNPTSNVLNLNLTEEGIHTLELFNSQGQIVSQMQLNDYNNALDLGSLNNGIYYLKLTNQEGQIGRKTLTIMK